MRQLSLDFPEAARRAALVYERAEPQTRDVLERRVTGKPWRESSELLAEEETIRDERLTNLEAEPESGFREELWR